ATSFFPNASTCVLAGLEPVGEVPDLTSLSSFAINEELQNLEVSTGSLFNFIFFITKNMKPQLRDGPVYGASPILYVFLARTGKTIHAVDFVNLDKNGDLHLSDEVPDADANNGASQQHLAAP